MHLSSRAEEKLIRSIEQIVFGQERHKVLRFPDTRDDIDDDESISQSDL